MRTSLSDLLTCPRCGPTYGLVLLPHEVADRRVVEGVLGCANCRERYPVTGGVADLRAGGDATAEAEGREPEEKRPGAPPGGARAGDRGAPDPPADGAAGDRAAAVRLAALLGLAEASGVVLVAGPAAAHAGALSELLEDVEVVAVVGGGRGGPGVNALRVSSSLPLRSGSLRGVALTGERSALLEEGARLLQRGARLVLDPAPADARERLAEAGAEVLAEEERVVVALRSA